MRKYFFIIFITFLSVVSAFGQISRIDSLKNEYDQLYGLDMLLYNGKKYFSDFNPIQGHAFWGRNDYFKGDIYLKGKVFRNNLLKYDLLRQEFILSYSSNGEQHHPIVLTSALIDSIKTQDVIFVQNSYSGIPQTFVQKIHQGKVSCYISWIKTKYEKLYNNYVRIAVSKEKKDYYLVVDSKVNSFHNGKTFVKLFSKKNQKKIKKYLNDNKIRFKDIGDKELEQLVLFSESLMN